MQNPLIVAHTITNHTTSVTKITTMKQLLDFMPLVLFALSFFGLRASHGQTEAMMIATMVLMAATVAQMSILYALERRLSHMHKLTLGLILTFGLLTVLLRDESFIKWKPTVFYIATAIALAVGLGLKKNFLQLLLGSQLTLPPHAWLRLVQAWIVYSLAMAALNAYVALQFTTAQWMGFKLWGYIFPIGFVIAQTVYIARFLRTSDDSSNSV